jgi:hypothetical protein
VLITDSAEADIVRLEAPATTATRQPGELGFGTLDTIETVRLLFLPARAGSPKNEDRATLGAARGKRAAKPAGEIGLVERNWVGDHR